MCYIYTIRNTCNNGLSHESGFTRDKMGVKPSTLGRTNSAPTMCPAVHFCVDHRWIIFHLITPRIFYERIKSNLTPHKSLPYDHAHLSSRLFQNPNVKCLSMMGNSMTEEDWSSWWDNQCEEIDGRRNLLWAACRPPPLPGGNRGVICGHWWFLWPPRNPRK